MTSAQSQLAQDNAFGFFDARLKSDQVFHPSLVSNADGNTMLKAILDELKRSHRFFFSVAFITPGAIAMLKQALIEFQGEGTIVTSTYLGFNSPAALRELLNLDGVNVFLHPDSGHGFHAKGYIFEQAESTTAIVGSSNLTGLALLKNHEWNLRFSALPDGDIVQQLGRAVAAHIEASVALTHEFIDTYQLTWAPPQRAVPAAGGANPIEHALRGSILPNAMQTEALAEIQAMRDAGERRAVVISATGTGKTILSALDVKAYDPDRMLFVVHREQILDRAIEEFKRVLDAPDEEFGKFVGSSKDLDCRYVFASIQSLSLPKNLALIEADDFDYVLIDEVHRAGAASYRRVLQYLEPAFLLGMTATPERSDEINVLELFDYNVPYEIRLQKALEADMLAPFHYYGVTDFVRGDGEVIDDLALLGQLVASERIDHLISKIETYGHVGVPVRGLIFCSRNDEAAELSSLLNQREINGRKLRTIALNGADPIAVREAAVDRLERGDLDYIATVDIFNEGIDIPSVNQVIMLRQTQSSIIFTQQLGRGLRKAAGKDHLVVIDFIGNYANNYLIPIALFGDSTLNKDSIRKKIIDSQDAGAISGLSSVSFDEISKDRIFRSLEMTTLDSMQNLKRAFLDLRFRLGQTPRLIDFARFDTVDPSVLATKQKNYWAFLRKVGETQTVPSLYEGSVLNFLSAELLNGKRPHELLLLERLLGHPGPLTLEEFEARLRGNELVADTETLGSVHRVLTLEFYKTADAAKYGGVPLIELKDGSYLLSPQLAMALASSSEFSQHVRDVVDAGLYLARHRYQWTGKLEIGQRYSRKDVCRLLNWHRDEQSTMYGYKTDFNSNSCPIFVTYHKGEEVTASTKYEDQFISPSTLAWYSKSNRKITSGEVLPIVGNEIALHLFAKKDDGEGTDFYYLGPVTAEDARQEHMPDGKGKQLPVVAMNLNLASPIESSLYEYLATPTRRSETV